MLRSEVDRHDHLLEALFDEEAWREMVPYLAGGYARSCIDT